jgi:rRNA-processing protein FCF1
MNRIKDACAASVLFALQNSGFVTPLPGSDVDGRQQRTRWEEAFRITNDVMLAYGNNSPSAATLEALVSRGCRGSWWAASRLFFEYATTLPLPSPALAAHTANACLEAGAIRIASHVLSEYDAHVLRTSSETSQSAHAVASAALLLAQCRHAQILYRWEMALTAFTSHPQLMRVETVGAIIQTCGRSQRREEGLRVFRAYPRCRTTVESLLAACTGAEWLGNLRVYASAAASSPTVWKGERATITVARCVAIARVVGNPPDARGSRQCRGWSDALRTFSALREENRGAVATSMLRVFDVLAARQPGVLFDTVAASVLHTLTMAYMEKVRLPNFAPVSVSKTVARIVSQPLAERDTSRTIFIPDTNVLIRMLVHPPSEVAILELIRAQNATVLVPLPVIREVVNHIRVRRCVTQVHRVRLVRGTTTVVETVNDASSQAKEIGVGSRYETSHEPPLTLLQTRRALWQKFNVLARQEKWVFSTPLQHYRAMAAAPRDRFARFPASAKSDAMDEQIVCFAEAVQRASSIATIFATTDTKLADAARKRGIAVLEPLAFRPEPQQNPPAAAN